ncbi:MAG: Ig-like domain-containing protein [Acidobacteriota bacterium]|nr:Ig-like domain-containing protein [Acidobacteriota bacterium]
MSFRVFLFLGVAILAASAFAHDVTLTGTSSFAALDGSSSDHDGSVNGVFTVDDGNLVVNGTVNCNDDGPGNNSACSMVFAVSGNMTVNSGGALYAENRSGSGNGGGITLTVGGNLALNGTAIVSAASTSNGNSNGGSIAANVSDNVTLASGTTLHAGAPNGQAGSITVASGGVIVVDGNVFSGPSRTLLASRLTGAALNGGNGNQSGGAISMSSTTFVEPAIVIGATANIVSQGEKNATGPVTLDACGIEIRGLVAALSRKETAARVTIRSGKNVLVDGTDLGAAGTRQGILRADSTQEGASDNGVDIFASESVQVLGPPAAGTLFAVTSVPAGKANKDGAGTIRVISLGASVSASGRAFLAGVDGKATRGGLVSIAAFDDVNLDGATIVAVGDWSKPKKQSAGGTIEVRSHSGDLFWRNGTGDVRPVGSQADVPPAEQGKIILTACGTIDTAGSTYPTNGVPTGVFPQTQTGVCSPAAPSLPAGTPALVTCNTPPVANDATASTNEDNTVTITLSGSDADGDPLTFTIVSGPANGTLGPIISTGPNTATVDYTPNLNYNGSDSFVYRAHDGNGGTDDANVSITIAPVNDPPTFLAGPTVSAFEDSGPQIIANWVTSISSGPADESAQTVTFIVTNDNNALFSVQPSVDSDGTLTFTPATNRFGSATITIVAQDNGGTANGGDDTSNAQTSTINVNGVNDEPLFTAGPSQTVNEDAGAQTVSPWATGISAGPNEGSQTLVFVTSNNNIALFSAQPAVAADGTLTYTPAADANGSATVTVVLQDNGGTANGGDDTSPSQTFTITVNAVNDAPSFASGGDVTVNEDSGAYSASWATGISAGPADESGQSLTFAASNDNGALFSMQPAVSPSGVLTFTLAANTFGSATVTVTLSDNGGTANGGVNTSASQTFTISVNTINDEPSFTSGGDVTVNEDSGAYSAAWASAISAGPNESGQALTFVVSSDNNALFASQPSISPSGVLTFTPAANANGVATVSVYLMDDGGTANGGDDTSPAQTFVITVNAVNDEPSFAPGGNVSVLEDSGSYSAAWATGISAGPNEGGQTVAFNVSNNNNGLFSAQPSISPAGVLTFTVAANTFGSATVTVFLTDDGGTANGGDDTSPAVTFTINVDSVNDAPSFVPGGNVTLNEDSGAYSAAWATAISAGPANEAGQTVSFNVSSNNNALFSAQPSIASNGTLTFTPAPNAFGSAIVTVSLTDNGGTANGGVDTSAAVTFTITVNAVNDAPIAGADSWNTFGNTELRVDLATGTTPNVAATTGSGTGVLHNDADPEGDPFSITSVVGCGDVTAPFVCAFGGGSVLLLNSNGTFTFTPGPGETSASFQYVVTDAPSAGSPASTTGTVTLTLSEMIWYVNSSGPLGNGTSRTPFTDFSSLNGPGGVGDVDAPNAYIFVHNSAVTGSIGLELNQRFLGEGVGLTVNTYPLVPAGPNPTVTSATDTVTVGGGVTGVEIAGLTLSSTGGNAIDVTNTSSTGPSSASIHDNVISGASAEGIDVNAGSTAGTTTVTINATSITSSGNGLDVSGLGQAVISYTNGTVLSTGGSGINMVGSGNLTVSGLTNVTISGNTVGNGISINTVRFDAIAGGSFDTVNGGTIAVGAAGNPVGGAGVVMSSVSGDFAIGSLSVFGGTSGVTIGGSGLYTGSTGMRITNGGGSISAPAGVGLSVSNATIGAANLNFTRISAAGGANGILLNNTGASGGLTVTGDGTGAANASGGLVQNTSGVGVSLTSSRNVTLTQLNIANTGDHGININSVTNFTFQDASIINAGNANEEQGMSILNLFGTSLIEDVTLDQIQEDGIQVRQNATDDPSADSLTIRRLNVLNHQPGFGESGIEVQSDLASNLTVLIDDSDFAINANGILGVAASTAVTHTGTFSLTVQNSIFNCANALGSGSIQILGGGSGTANHTVTGNTINGTKFDGIRVNNDDTGTTNATVTNNAVTGSGATNNGEGITLRQDGDGTMTATITSNIVTEFMANGIHLNSNDALVDDVGLELRAVVTNNTASVRSDGFGAGLLIDVGDGSGNARNDVCANISGNVLSGTELFTPFDDDIALQLNETAFASLRVTQASPAALSTANNGASVGFFENPPNTITFNGGVCP